ALPILFRGRASFAGADLTLRFEDHDALAFACQVVGHAQPGDAAAEDADIALGVLAQLAAGGGQRHAILPQRFRARGHGRSSSNTEENLQPRCRKSPAVFTFTATV